MDEAIAQSIGQDIETVERLASSRGVSLPDICMEVANLDGASVPQHAPEHALDIPSTEIPGTLSERCEWQIARDSYQVIQAEDGRVWVLGASDSGALYGATDAVCRLTGIIWAGPDEDEGSVFGPVRDLPEGVVRPRFAYRGRYSGPMEWFARNRMNFGMCGARQWKGRPADEKREQIESAAARAVTRTLSEHAMDYYLPEEVLKAHPEWQGMRDGKRCLRDVVEMPECPLLNGELPIQPCYSTPEVAEYITDRMAELRQEVPAHWFFGAWPHDGVNNWCHCDDCLKKSPYEHMHHLAVRLREKLGDNTPLELIAYSNMLNLPLAPLPRDENMYAFFCAYLRHFRHRIYEAGGPDEPQVGVRYPEPDRINPVDEREYGDIFERWMPVWKEAGTMPAVFEYTGIFPDETRRTDHQRYLRSPTAELREDEAAWYAGHGVRIVILCGRQSFWPDSFPDLSWAQSLWGGEPADSLRQRYYAGLAGEAGPRLAAAVENVADALRNTDAIPEAELQALEKVLPELADEKRAQAYRDWCAYIRLGRESWQCLKSGKYQDALDAEDRVRAFVRENQERIPPAEVLINFSELYSERIGQEERGETGKDYTL